MTSAPPVRADYLIHRQDLADAYAGDKPATAAISIVRKPSDQVGFALCIPPVSSRAHLGLDQPEPPPPEEPGSHLRLRRFPMQPPS